MQIILVSFLTNSLSIRILSSYLKKNGFEVICIFCPAPASQSSMEAIIHFLERSRVLFVGMTLVTDDYYRAVLLTLEIKRRLGVPVLWGGAHPSIMPDECLRYADMVCRGEGEEAVLELARSFSSNGKPMTNIKNIYFRTPNGVVRNELRDLEENLDKYPFPDFDFSSQFVVTKNGLESVSEDQLEGVYSIMTSRGCPYACTYCYNSYRRAQYKDKGRYLRLRSIENVVDELKYAKTIFRGLKTISFWDDTFLSRDISDFEKFRSEYKNSIALPFFGLAEPMAFDEEKIDLLADCGLIHLQVGIQSGSERLNRELYHRLVSRQKILNMANTMHRLGIKVTYDLIFNNPYETKEDLKQTVALLLELPRPFQIQGYNLIFYPGSSLTQKALNDGFVIPKHDQEDFSSIQGENNSPVAAREKAVLSSRFYVLRYDSKEKAYFNSLIIFSSFLHAPKALVRYFLLSQTRFNELALPLLMNLYLFLSKVKNFRFKGFYE